MDDILIYAMVNIFQGSVSEFDQYHNNLKLFSTFLTVNLKQMFQKKSKWYYFIVNALHLNILWWILQKDIHRWYNSKYHYGQHFLRFNS